MPEQLKNQWLIQNNILVNGIKRELIEYGYKGLDDLNVRKIQGVLESAVIEIARLQRELDKVNNKLNETKKTKSSKKEENEGKKE